VRLLKKSIDTLIPDIYALFETDFEFKEEDIKAFADDIARHIANRVQERKEAPTLRMSNLGTPCLRKLYYQINNPEEGEKLDGQTRFKFLYGDILESLVLFLARAAGHEVSGGQTTLSINGVEGHRDAVIDGVLVDVKSASSFGFKKFENHELEGSDPFGYLDQINAYLFASQDDPEVLEKKKAAFLAVDKVLGKMTLDVYNSNGVDYHDKIESIRSVLVQPRPPERYYKDVPDGKSGNRKLGLECSYCAFKWKCWPGLKQFNYSSGPVFLSHIARPPRVEEASFD
jgi:hypothetical protein